MISEFDLIVGLFVGMVIGIFIQKLIGSKDEK